MFVFWAKVQATNARSLRETREPAGGADPSTLMEPQYGSRGKCTEAMTSDTGYGKGSRLRTGWADCASQCPQCRVASLRCRGARGARSGLTAVPAAATTGPRTSDDRTLTKKTSLRLFG